MPSSNEIHSQELQMFGSVAIQSENTHNNLLLSNQNLYETDKDNESSQNNEEK